MAKLIYVNSLTGDNSNDGLSVPQSKATILGARSVTAAGDIVLINPGVYLEADVAFIAATDDNVLYMKDPLSPGRVIIDFENRAGSQAAENGAANWRINRVVYFLNIEFRNPFSNDIHSLVAGELLAVFMHCVFSQRDGTANTGRGMSGVNSQSDEMFARNCTFYNLGVGLYSLLRNNIQNCYFNSVTTTFSFCAGTSNYNAYSGSADVNGIDTDATDPGLRDAAAGDFRLDPTTINADYQTFITGGLDGGRIGAFGLGGFYYRNDIASLRFITADPTPASGNPQPSWENEGPGGTGTYLDGTPGDIIEDVTTKALKIDLGTTPAATGGRVRSPVFDMGAAGSPEFVNAAFSGFEDGPAGALIDTEATLPQKFEYRSSGSSFLIGDGSPAWIEIEQKDNFAVTDRYIQFRAEFRTDHTNA